MKKLGLSLAVVFLSCGPAWTHDPIQAKVPHDLDFLPRNTFLVVHLRAGDLWKRFAAQGILTRLERMEDDLLSESVKHLGFPLATLERFTVIVPTGDNPEPAMVIVVNKPLNRTLVADALLKPSTVFRAVGDDQPAPPQPQRQERKVKSRTLLVLEEEYRKQALCFLSDRVFVYGSTVAVTAALETADDPVTTPFAVQVRKHAKEHAALAALNMEFFPARDRRQFESAPFILPTLLRSRSCFLTYDAKDGLEIQAAVTFADEVQAQTAQKEFSDGLRQLRQLLPMGLQEMAHVMVEDPDAPEHFYAFLKALDADLQKAQVVQNGTTVRATLRHACTEKFLGGLIADLTLGMAGTRAMATFHQVGDVLGGGAPQRIRADKAEALQKIAAAFAKYQAQHGHYPPAAIYAKDGAPLLSWRVALLPYLGQEELYQQFKLDEPWYSKHNRPLLKKMPAVYGTQAQDFPGRTPFRMILGPGAAYDGAQGVATAGLKDGPGQTLLVVEDVRWHSVGWTRPEGYRFGPDWPLPRLTSGEYSKGFYALFADGKVRFVPYDVGEKTLRALITKAGGEKVEEKELGEEVK